MPARDVLQRPLDAASLRVKSLGTPEEPKDATFTDNASVPKAVAKEGRPGSSLLASPADHVHPSPAPMRMAARGTTTVAPAARVTLATFKRAPGEMFPPGGFAFIRENVAGASWENEVDGGSNLALYHERTGNPNELAFRAQNTSARAQTVEWATVGLSLPGE